MVILELVLPTAPYLFVGLGLQTSSEDGQSLRLVRTPLNRNEGGRFASVLNLVTIVFPVQAAEKTVVLDIPIPRGYSHIG